MAEDAGKYATLWQQLQICYISDCFVGRKQMHLIFFFTFKKKKVNDKVEWQKMSKNKHFWGKQFNVVKTLMIYECLPS